MDRQLEHQLSQLRQILPAYRDEELAQLVEQARRNAYTAVMNALQDTFEKRLWEQLGADSGGVLPFPIVSTPPANNNNDNAEKPKAISRNEITHAEKDGHPSNLERLPQPSPPNVQIDKETVKTEIAKIRATLAKNEQFLRQPLIAEPATAEPTLAEDEYHWYVYGIIGDVPLKQTVRTIHEEEQIRLFKHGRLQAVTSKIAPAKFKAEQLQDGDSWLKEKAQIHQAVLAQILQETAVIPLRFGTICPQEPDIIRLLTQYASEFETYLQKFKTRQEWGVKLYISGDQLHKRLMRTDPDLQQIKSQIESCSEGTAYLLRQKRDRLLERAVASELDTLSADCHQKLSAIADESRINPPSSPALTEGTAKVLLNGAYLIADENVDSLASLVEELATHYEPFGCDLHLSGPWPAYNFVQLKLE